MLRSLAIRNFAIIDRLDIEFGPGLNALTGETGAGKSIVIGALAVVLGERASPDLVKTGKERATVDAVFDLPADCGLGLDDPDIGEGEDLVLTREIHAGGRSAARINGRPVSLTRLKAIGDALVDIHGQHEHQYLLSPARHVEVLDDWGAPVSTEARNRRREASTEYRRLVAERTAIETDARERARRIDLLSFQTEEIRNARLVPGEDDELTSERMRLANVVRLQGTLGEILERIDGDEVGAITMLAVASRALTDLVAMDPALAPMSDTCAGALAELEEVSRDLSSYAETLEEDPERLQIVEDRLDLIRSLMRKYGADIEEVLQFLAAAETELDQLGSAEQRCHELDAAIARADGRLVEATRELDQLRHSHAAGFTDAVRSELQDLAMGRTQFEVAFLPSGSGHHPEAVEFLFSANQGEAARPLARIASGGEISRVMLALKSAMAHRGALPTMVFDEVDVGVGGRTAAVLGEKIHGLAVTTQVVCITHLAPIAARAELHCFIEKVTDGDSTVVTVRPVAGSERVEEVARMLGGTEPGGAAYEHARELLGITGH